MTIQHFGRYEIKGEIGRGGMATVFHAYDPRFERDIAIKVLPREFLHDPQFRVRFEREAKTIALLEHPAIVPVYDFGEEEDLPYIVMRYMSGGSLDERLAQGALSLDEAIKIISRLAPALDAAHAKGVIHRDLKPGNILYDQYGNAFLSDFGIARLMQSGSKTLTGDAVLGTPAYMSPEQVKGGATVDARSDIYSLGIIIYEMLTGKTPYEADTAAQLMMMHILEPVPEIRDIRADLPNELSDVLEVALAKDPADRYPTASEFASALENSARNMGGLNPVQIGQVSDAGALTRVAPGAAVTAPSAGSLSANMDSTIPSALPVTTVSSVPPRRKIPIWMWVGGGLILVLLVGFSILGGTYLMLPKSSQNPEPTTTQENVKISFSATPEIIAAVINPTLSPTASPTPPASQTYTPTLPPVASETPPPPSATPTPVPQPTAQIIGGGDKIAFLNGSNIWVANLDGSELTQITIDGTQKNHLQWSMDGKSISYISGLCAQRVDIESHRIENIACFEWVSSLDAFEFSPDDSQIAVSVNRELFLIPNDLEKLAQVEYWTDIRDMAECKELAPYASSTGASYAVKEVHWSDDMNSLAMVVLGVEAGRQVDLVRVIDISVCTASPPRIDEFPATRFTISGYDSNPTIQNIGWDGNLLFALTGFIRNDGFGDLYTYNMDLHQANSKVNPINNVCCYREPSFSPDGSYLSFAFQDITLGAQSKTLLYYAPYGTLGTGAPLTPIPLPDDFFADNKEGPNPIIRPVFTP